LTVFTLKILLELRNIRKKVEFFDFKNTFTWEKRKLSDISEKVTQKNTNNSFSEVFTNSAERGIISQLDFFDKDIANQKNISGYFIVKNDDFVYNPRISNLAPVGPIKRNKLGRNGVMSPLYYIFRTHSISPSFLEYYFEGTQWHYFMYLNGDTGARADRFAIKDSVFSTMPIFITSSSEQIQIGSFFKSLDDLITVNQRDSFFTNFLIFTSKLSNNA
ncbi:MAG: hypothetical protein ABF784_07630, partial [Oenococcus oeni]